MSFHGLSQCQVSAVLHDAFIPLKPVPPGLTLNTLPNIAAAQCTTLALFATQLLCAPRKHLSDFTSVSFFFLFFPRDKVSPCSPGCPRTHPADQAGQDHTEKPRLEKTKQKKIPQHSVTLYGHWDLQVGCKVGEDIWDS